MKRWICLLLSVGVLLCQTGCIAHKATRDLMMDISGDKVDVLPDMENDAVAAVDFAVGLFQAAAGGENTLISPVSVLSALAMTANGAEGNTLEQMEQVLGLSREELNGFWLAYHDSLSGEELKTANSIWFADRDSFTVKEEFLQTNATYYHADIYQAPFDETTLTQINDWVREKTDGMIDGILEEIPAQTLMILINALAFDAQWESTYNEYQVSEDTFTTEDGNQQAISMMHSTEGTYLSDDLATGFIKYYEGRRYAFAALLPNEGVSIGDYISSLTGEHLLEMLNTPQSIDVHASIPKFEMEYTGKLSHMLAAMGMPDAFDAMAADFSGLGQLDGGNLYIDQVLHKTCISVFEQGTKAGAVTAELVCGTGPVQEEYRIVRLDRPFVYLLIDCENHLPLFIGTVMDMEG